MFLAYFLFIKFISLTGMIPSVDNEKKELIDRLKRVNFVIWQQYNVTDISYKIIQSRHSRWSSKEKIEKDEANVRRLVKKYEELIHVAEKIQQRTDFELRKCFTNDEKLKQLHSDKFYCDDEELKQFYLDVNAEYYKIKKMKHMAKNLKIRTKHYFEYFKRLRRQYSDF